MNEKTPTPNQSNPQPVAPKKSNNKIALLIGFLAIVIIIQGVKIYLDNQEKKEVKEQLSSTEEQYATTMQRLTEIQAEFDLKIAEIQRLGGDVSELQAAKAEIEKELKKSKMATGTLIKELRNKVEGYEQLLLVKDEEIEKLKTVNKELFTENVTLKTEKNQLGDSIHKLSQSKEVLATKVAIASQLKAENVKIVAVNDKGKERESPFKNRQVGKIKVDFNLAENNVAPIEGKKIIIRIIDQSNQVIFDVARGSGTFMVNGKEEFYTAAQEILFDNTRQKLSYLYDKGSDYAGGTYTVEIYTDDYLIGNGQFVVK